MVLGYFTDIPLSDAKDTAASCIFPYIKFCLGSDVAAASTSAARRGDDLIINFV